MIRILLGTMVAGCFAVLFLMPIILTITNSFMSSSEIAAYYGQVFATTDSGGKVRRIVPDTGWRKTERADEA